MQAVTFGARDGTIAAGSGETGRHLGKGSFMAVDFESSETKKNLEAAFAGESQAHTKYAYYASKAKKEGYVQISDIFAETSGNESEHAKMWFKYLHGGEVPDTLTNIKDAAAGENYEWTTMYKEFAEKADEEGF